MKIKKIYIKNLYSIEKEIIKFANPLYPLVLVGENNTGKTNILKALNLFFTNNARDLTEEILHNPTESAEILIEFSDLNEWEKSQISEVNLIEDKLFVRQIGTPNPQSGSRKLQYFALRKLDEDEKGTSRESLEVAEYVSHNGNGFFDDDIQEQAFFWFPNPSGPANFLEGYLPKFLYVPAIDDIDDQLKIQTNTFFGEIIAEIIRKLEGESEVIRKIRDSLRELSGLDEISELSTNLTEELQKIFDDVSFKFEISSPNFFKIIQQYANTVITDEVETKPKLKGEGVQRAIIFAIFKVYSDILIKADTERERSLIFAIEEPELYLHPHTQKVFLEVLKTIAWGGSEEDTEKSDQVIFATHAPNLVEIKSYDSVCLVKKDGRQTWVSQVTQGLFPQGTDEEREEFRLIIEFDPERNALFFAKKVLLVEGDTEKVSFRLIAEKMGKNLNKLGISIVECGGKNKIQPFVRVLNNFKIPYMVVCDEDPVEQIDLDSISCPSCRRRASSKLQGQQSKFNLNETLKNEVETNLGVLRTLSPDFERLCLTTTGSNLSRPFSAFKFLSQASLEDIPEELKTIVNSLCDEND